MAGRVVDGRASGGWQGVWWMAGRLVDGTASGGWQGVWWTFKNYVTAMGGGRVSGNVTRCYVEEMGCSGMRYVTIQYTEYFSV